MVWRDTLTQVPIFQLINTKNTPKNKLVKYQFTITKCTSISIPQNRIMQT
jgi:hypothetical protein